MSEHESQNEYLWSGRGAPDPDVAALERLLAPARLRVGLDVSALPGRALSVRAREADAAPHFRPSAPDARRAAVAGPRRWAMAAMLALATAAAWLAMRPPAAAVRSGWTAELKGGSATVAGAPLGPRGALREGQWLATGADGAAQVRAPGIGTIDLQPATRVRLARARGEQRLMELAGGTIEAFITSPPRVFLVDTPAGRAVDMGCVYTLRASEGQTELNVSLGYVILESEAKSSTVPAGAACTMRRGTGPGLPVFGDATEQFRNAAFMFDIGKDPRSGLETLLAAARPRDAMTLWHLLRRVNAEDRGVVFDALARLDPPPPGVTREGVLALDGAVLERWWNSLRM